MKFILLLLFPCTIFSQDKPILIKHVNIATVNPALFLNRQKDLGTIEVGKLADLVLLDANPLINISNTRKINTVVANGKLLQRNDLDKMLEEAKSSVR